VVATFLATETGASHGHVELRFLVGPCTSVRSGSACSLPSRTLPVPRHDLGSIGVVILALAEIDEHLSTKRGWYKK